MIKSENLPLILIVVGICLLVLSAIVARVVGSRLVWNERAAARLQQASQNYHDALHSAAHAPADPEVEASFEGARAEYIRQQSRLHAVEGGAIWSAAALRWLGFIAAAAGILLHVVRKWRES